MIQLGPIYAITDPALLPGERLFSAVAEALEAGVRTLQYRDKSASSANRCARAKRLLELCNANDACLIINDDWELAREIGAHGVHLGQDDPSAALARKALGDAALVGVTCHASLELAKRAVNDGASYVAFGRFFASSTKPSAPLAPLDLVATACASVPLPVVVIGGITLDNMAPLVRAGASSLAVCQSLFGAESVGRAAQSLIARYLALRPPRNDNPHE